MQMSLRKGQNHVETHDTAKSLVTVKAIMALSGNCCVSTGKAHATPALSG
jgi:hypothetical protein